MTDPFYAGGGIGLGPRPPVAEAEPYPQPQLQAHLLTITGCCPIKTAVAELSADAWKLGWQTIITHARGQYPHAKLGTPGKVKDSLAVRMWAGDERAAAVYVGGSTWSWDYLYRWTVGMRPHKYGTITEFRQSLLLP